MRFFIIFLFSYHFTAAQLKHLASPDAQTGVFDTVKTVDIMERINIAYDIYHQDVKRKDSTFAIKSINELIEISDELGDNILKCFATSTLADHYARMRGFNETSTRLHLKAIDLAVEYDFDLANGMGVFRLGRYYYNFKKYPQAFEALLKAENILKKIGYKEDFESGEFLFFLANTYYEIGDYAKAESYFTECLKYSKREYFIQIQAKNSLASIAKEQKKYDKALFYLNQILAMVTAKKDSTWIGLSTGFIGDIYFLKNKPTIAQTYLEKGYLSNIKHNEWKQANLCILDLATIQIAENKLIDAENFIALAYQCMKHTNSFEDRKRLYEVLAKVNEKKGNFQQAYIYGKQLRLVEDSIKTEQDLKVFNNIQLRVTTQKLLGEISTLEAETNAAKIKRNAIIFILIILLVSFGLVYNQYRLKTQKDAEIAKNQQALLESEKQMAENEWKNAEIQLQNFTENLRSKNELIEQFATEIEQLKKTIPENSAQSERVEHFEKLLQTTILTDEDWDNFRLLFDKVHKGFFFSLKEKFPNLSLAETRMSSLIKLQLSNREMANISGVSIDAIKKAKQRLRKKIASESEETELEDILITM